MFPSKSMNLCLTVACLLKVKYPFLHHCIRLTSVKHGLFCYASLHTLPLTNSNSYFPTLWYTWHGCRCILGALCTRIGVTGASSPQSIRYFRYDCSGLFAIWLSLTWLPCSGVAPFRTGAPVYVVESFLPHILHFTNQSTHHSLFRNVRFNQWR